MLFVSNCLYYFNFSSSVSLFWTGFGDPQSGIHHFEACIGTVVTACDITPYFECHLSSKYIKTGLNLPESTNLYVTVQAYNNNGMSVTKSSDYFRVDTTAPKILKKPSPFKKYTSFIHAIDQWDRSVLRISWKFEDTESSILRHLVKVVTHHDGYNPVEHIELGSEDRLTLTLEDKNWLQNGDVYKILVTACNAAGLCSTAESEDMLVDSTPPHLGGFKPPMTWHNFLDATGRRKASLNLTWYGFHDQESGINCYYIGVGKTYSGNELSAGLLKILSNNTLAESKVSVVINEHVSSDTKIVLSIIAENNAGLMSSISRVSLNALTTTLDQQSKNNSFGVFEIEKHSCDIHFCNKDCTCAVIGKPCSNAKTNMTCTTLNSTVKNPYNVSVNVRGGLIGRPYNMTTSSSCLAAHWVVESGHSSIKRFEWSMGIKDEPYGTGIFDMLTDIIWRDIGTIQQIVHCLQPNHTLISRTEYVIYIRAWVEMDLNIIFKSRPVMVDHSAPSVYKGRSIDDFVCKHDYDIIDQTTEAVACWTGVFYEQQSHIIYYTVGLGTSPGGKTLKI